jgi:hypothetical protein
MVGAAPIEEKRFAEAQLSNDFGPNRCVGAVDLDTSNEVGIAQTSMSLPFVDSAIDREIPVLHPRMISIQIVQGWSSQLLQMAFVGHT